MKSLILVLICLTPFPAMAGEKVFSFGRDADGQRCFLSYEVEQKPFFDSSDKLLTKLTIHRKAPGLAASTSLRLSKGGEQFKKFTSVGSAQVIEIEGDDILRPAGITLGSETCKNLRPLREDAFQTSLNSQVNRAEQHAAAPAESTPSLPVEIPEDFKGDRAPALLDVTL